METSKQCLKCPASLVCMLDELMTEVYDVYQCRECQRVIVTHQSGQETYSVSSCPILRRHQKYRRTHGGDGDVSAGMKCDACYDEVAEC